MGLANEPVASLSPSGYFFGSIGYYQFWITMQERTRGPLEIEIKFQFGNNDQCRANAVVFNYYFHFDRTACNKTAGSVLLEARNLYFQPNFADLYKHANEYSKRQADDYQLRTTSKYKHKKARTIFS